MLPALDITVYPLQTSLPYHILLLLLTAESPEVCNSNLIGSNFFVCIEVVTASLVNMLLYKAID